MGHFKTSQKTRDQNKCKLRLLESLVKIFHATFCIAAISYEIDLKVGAADYHVR